MGDTLETSIKSIMNQIDSRFELVIVDDGSDDESAKVLAELESRYENIRVSFLPRNPKRKLGQTRNIAISLARGEWIIFHLDTDDFIGPFITDFVEATLLLDTEFKSDILYTGVQIHMAKREFLLKHGPFKNIYRGEDRDLYQRLARNGEWKIIVHKRFIHRLRRSKKKLLKKALIDNWDQMVTDLQLGNNPGRYLKENLERFKGINWKVMIFRLLLVFPAYVTALMRGVFEVDDRLNDYNQFAQYRTENSKSLSDWLEFLQIENKNFEGMQVSIDQEIFY